MVIRQGDYVLLRGSDCKRKVPRSEPRYKLNAQTSRRNEAGQIGELTSQPGMKTSGEHLCNLLGCSLCYGISHHGIEKELARLQSFHVTSVSSCEDRQSDSLVTTANTERPYFVLILRSALIVIKIESCEMKDHSFLLNTVPSRAKEARRASFCSNNWQGARRYSAAKRETGRCSGNVRNTISPPP